MLLAIQVLMLFKVIVSAAIDTRTTMLPVVTSVNILVEKLSTTLLLLLEISNGNR